MRVFSAEYAGGGATIEMGSVLERRSRRETISGVVRKWHRRLYRSGHSLRFRRRTCPLPDARLRTRAAAVFRCPAEPGLGSAKGDSGRPIRIRRQDSWHCRNWRYRAGYWEALPGSWHENGGDAPRSLQTDRRNRCFAFAYPVSRFDFVIGLYRTSPAPDELHPYDIRRG